ncbi:MAG: type III-A CRISPR-associated RAMP protein Csm4 [Bacteroidales bacterium]|nr:type III-A CRISPR-associated RAMP protein Csm4 [Bacteroidales bacterium]
MATFKIYKLHFTSPLHISNHRADDSISLKTMQSDAMYAALMSCLAKKGHAIPDDGNMGFTISSLFPYYQQKQDSQPVYFLPMPMQSKMPEVAASLLKTIKKVGWVDASLYGDILAGHHPLDGSSDAMSCIHGAYFTSREGLDYSEFVQSEVVQRACINDRTGHSNAEPYFVDRILFKDWSGLYFLADGDTTLLDEALPLLATEGVGSDRHLGFGFFDYSIDSITIDVPQHAEYRLALSIFIPETKEQLLQMLDADEVAYDFSRRGGWITTHPYNSLRKNVIYAFLPGSVFRNCTEQVCVGKIVDLRPEVGELSPSHPIWRCGRALMLPINLNS